MNPYHVSEREVESLCTPAGDVHPEVERVNRSQENFLVSLRNNIARSPIGSLLVSYHASLRKDLAETFGGQESLPAYERRPGGSRKRVLKNRNKSQMPPPLDPVPPYANRASRVSFVLPNISGRTRASRNGSIASSTSGSAGLVLPSSSIFHTRTQTASSIAPSCSNASSLADSTPPLTPDSACTPSSLLAPRVSQSWASLTLLSAREEGTTPPPPEKAELIKEGKKPQRPICYETLIEDISVDPAPSHPARVDEEKLETLTTASDESDEWLGLDYAVELSLRERRASECDAPSAGEHSKSPESWAAIHSGFIPPNYENEEYMRWRKWHKYLDRQAQKRRLQKAIAYQTTLFILQRSII
ncbi:hypothetical protein CERSUDRAFT_91333 [Gelatoporia subvermispora B]|uniref:Uncharacterized protein n=1 Tax=Ceriporiopsis subvermispora (strain B) TaxID=914234 RepID=M2PV02_CERS8|nr:hypothetical protein CERSUDRAFT_91333 [Gelatoporia subvermispora B]